MRYTKRLATSTSSTDSPSSRSRRTPGGREPPLLDTQDRNPTPSVGVLHRLTGVIAGLLAVLLVTLLSSALSLVLLRRTTTQGKALRSGSQRINAIVNNVVDAVGHFAGWFLHSNAKTLKSDKKR